MRRTKFLTTGLPRYVGLQTPDVPMSQSDHNQLRGLPNLQRIALINSLVEASLNLA
jgi:hypothetical protein